MYLELKNKGVHHLWTQKTNIDKKIGLENYINHLGKNIYEQTKTYYCS